MNWHRGEEKGIYEDMRNGFLRHAALSRSAFPQQTISLERHTALMRGWGFSPEGALHE